MGSTEDRRKSERTSDIVKRGREGEKRRWRERREEEQRAIGKGREE